MHISYMNKRLRRLSIQQGAEKLSRPKQMCSCLDIIPPDTIIRDWLRRQKQKREKRKEQPSVDAPIYFPEDRTEKKDDDDGGPIVIPILEKDDKDLN